MNNHCPSFPWAVWFTPFVPCKYVPFHYEKYPSSENSYLVILPNSTDYPKILKNHFLPRKVSGKRNIQF